MRKNRPVLYQVGKTLTGGWKVIEFIPKPSTSTGGNFSESYIVEREGKQAFMKALDFSSAMRSSNFIERLHELTEEYMFEEELYEICKSRRMSKVVQIIDKGTIPSEAGSVIPVPYLIFELAKGDIRSQLDFTKEIDIVWYLKILHNVATGLNQMHTNGIAHQDIKPSNVLVFGRQLHKVSDLGRGDAKELDSPYRYLPIAGDPGYAPPEGHYGHVEPDWIYRRQACDIYQLGSLMVFLFMQTSTTALLYKHLEPIYQYHIWSGSFKDVLPYLHVAFDKVVEEFQNTFEDRKLADELAFVLRILCNPDPKKRGHPRTISLTSNSLSLIRVITIFARLYKEYEIILTANGR